MHRPCQRHRWGMMCELDLRTPHRCTLSQPWPLRQLCQAWQCSQCVIQLPRSGKKVTVCNGGPTRKRSTVLFATKSLMTAASIVAQVSSGSLLQRSYLTLLRLQYLCTWSLCRHDLHCLSHGVPPRPSACIVCAMLQQPLVHVSPLSRSCHW